MGNRECVEHDVPGPGELGAESVRGIREIIPFEGLTPLGGSLKLPSATRPPRDGQNADVNIDDIPSPSEGHSIRPQIKQYIILNDLIEVHFFQDHSLKVLAI